MAPAGTAATAALPGSRQLLGRLMGAVLALLALGPPGLYFATGYGARASELLTKAEVKAELVSQFISRNPQLWQFEELRLRELLVRLPVEADDEAARILSASGAVVAESPRRVGWPSMVRGVPLYDAGRPVGWVEVRHGLGELLLGSALALLGGLASAAVLLSLLRRLIASHDRMAAAMASEQERARVTLQAIADAVISTDAQGRIEYLNPVAERLTQWPLAQARGQALDSVCPLVDERTQAPLPGPLAQALQPGGAAQGGGSHLALRRRDGALLAIECSAAPLHDAAGALSGGAMVFRDVTGARRLAQRITWAATHDALTALLNRPEFESRIDAALLSARNSQQQHVLCALDLDRFKAVNDSAGHAAGDALLRQLAQVLQDKLRQSDTLARLGGDEFGVLLAGCSMERARLIAAELLAAVRELRFHWQGRSFDVGVSMGLVAITHDSGSRAEIQAAADAALYAAKEQGRDRVCIYERDQADGAQRRADRGWAERLEQALAQDRLRLWHQPWQALGSGGADRHYTGMALRLADTDGQLQLPASFMAAAERHGLVPALDRWLIAAVCARHQALAQALGAPLVCAVPLSGSSLADEDLADFIREQAHRHGLPRGALCFELGAAAALNNLRGATRLGGALRAQGWGLALADAGIGSATLACLKALPLDALKIESSLTRGVATDAIDRTWVEALNRAGHLLGLRTVGAPADDADTVAALRQLGLDYAQGQALHPPLPA